MKKWKFETKVYAVAILIPALVTLLALAPFPQGIKIIGDLVFQEQAAVVTTPVAGTGTFYVKSTTPSTPVFVDDTGAEVTLGAAGAGAVDSVNGQTGVVALDADDIDDTSTTQKFTTAAEAAKLAGIETGATADQTDTEIATAYGNQVAAASQVEMEAGTEAAVRRMSPLRVAQAISALGGSGGDPTYGSDAGAADDTVYVSDDNWLGLGITSPLGPLHIYSETAAPRTYYDYFNDDPGSVPEYPGTASGWTSSNNIFADDASYASTAIISSPPQNTPFIVATNFGFAIPSGATINGVEVDVEGRGGVVETDVDLDAHLVIGGVADTAVDKATGANWTTTPTVWTYGGPTDDWGGVTDTEVNASDFGFTMRLTHVGVGTISIDYVTITIYYTTAAGDWLWSSGTDISDGTYTLRANATDQMRTDYTTGDTVFTGEVTAPEFIGGGAGLTGVTATVADDSVTNAKLAEMTAGRIKGRITTDGNPVDLTAAEVRTLLNVADGATANAGTVTSAAMSGTDGIEVDSGSPITTSGTFTLGVNASTLYNHLISTASTTTPITTDSFLYNDGGTLAEASMANLMLALTSTDNRLPKRNGTAGQIEDTDIIVDDSENITGLGTLNGHALPTGTADLVSTTATQRLTGKEIQPRVDSTTSTPVAINADDYDAITVSLTGNTIISAPSGSFTVVTQTILYRINQAAANSYTVTWNAVFKSGADWGLAGAIPAMSTTFDAWDYFLFIWNDGESEWQLLACSQGN